MLHLSASRAAHSNSLVLIVKLQFSNNKYSCSSDIHLRVLRSYFRIFTAKWAFHVWAILWTSRKFVFHFNVQPPASWPCFESHFDYFQSLLISVCALAPVQEVWSLRDPFGAASADHFLMPDFPRAFELWSCFLALVIRVLSLWDVTFSLAQQ